MGMKSWKFLKWFGMLFVVIGAVTAICLALAGLITHTPLLYPMALFFAAIFCGIGGFFARMGINALRREEEILSMGTQFKGKIFDYRQDRSVLINGAPTISLVVRYFDGGEMKEAVVPTGSPSEAEYPHGASVQICVYKGKAALVPHSVTDEQIPGQEDLLNPDYDVLGTHPTNQTTCPGCGAPLDIPIGMARVCPFCGRKVRADQ